MNRVTAVDVSFCQTNVDYNKVKADGIDTVIIRAGFGRETYQKDAQFEEHYKRAKAAGLKVGVYWFSYAYSVAEAKTNTHRLSVLRLLLSYNVLQTVRPFGKFHGQSRHE